MTQPSTNRPSQAELDAADSATDSWLMYNKGYRAERYSALNLINAGNAAQLHPVCMFQLGEIGTFATGPVEYDGLLYVTPTLDLRDRRDDLQENLEQHPRACSARR